MHAGALGQLDFGSFAVVGVVLLVVRRIPADFQVGNAHGYGLAERFGFVAVINLNVCADGAVVVDPLRVAHREPYAAEGSVCAELVVLVTLEAVVFEQLGVRYAVEKKVAVDARDVLSVYVVEQRVPLRLEVGFELARDRALV